MLEDNHPMKKLNDDLTRITINYLNDHLAEVTLPKTTLVCLPREVRRHHVNNSWLADEKILYQIKSFDFNQFSKVKEALAKLTNDFDDATKNRYRRYTDGHRGTARTNRDVDILATCQDDLHVQSLGKLRFRSARSTSKYRGVSFVLVTVELDTNRSIFNERNLWIAVTVRSTTSTKTFLAINLSASQGMMHTKNHRLHWFEGN